MKTDKSVLLLGSIVMTIVYVVLNRGILAEGPLIYLVFLVIYVSGAIGLKVGEWLDRRR